jgi:hypothetical protein
MVTCFMHKVTLTDSDRCPECDVHSGDTKIEVWRLMQRFEGDYAHGDSEDFIAIARTPDSFFKILEDRAAELYKQAVAETLALREDYPAHMKRVEGWAERNPEYYQITLDKEKRHASAEERYPMPEPCVLDTTTKVTSDVFREEIPDEVHWTIDYPYVAEWVAYRAEEYYVMYKEMI